MYSSDSEIKKRKITLILAAAGIGKRMGLDYPKQFFEHNGKPLFIFPLEIAEKSSLIDEIIIVTNENNIDLVEKQCNKYNIKKVKKILAGGKERQDSIYNALKEDEGSTYILVQDGVRPFMKEKYIEMTCAALDRDKSLAGAVIGVPVKDTIKVVGLDGEILATPNRAGLVAVHTPQTFRGDILKKAYKKAEAEKFLGTDDSSLVERIGEKVKIITGDYDNIKITTLEDLLSLK
ncbi:2-C-methyl-D-erythritol 4-phosphate cytidylyltransferase [Fusobacterium varium]|jgi:2-C-methyl-D-erythritol 4-phosphate cytidylyltransferase|uniref:2-C-methyl-D-erythritol 4-phosphate cytidylyltransferase n=1 Tax=Fusobacterium varium ATCC 27725 TaxID=469618 RepID=A0ABM6U2W2_FUSVA|nr:2-C-methyl-D-erythritol 4-phosphate cytidylyltransferase [Fusobacterium varium]MCD7980452.1 2-C-methyl-D-erythritol 4-phosphate cytidylyltransferase [Fusobacterium sp.]AVQ30635.1 2-C-methyl-D-erythritol 4-phosphate cytidylyltransferase [Fusobacterium varium ATCC 27725]EES65303.1 2-C-methyl-D-erythritol 4-phosphate cytidylyltransferase [Fusobacterium varium ATCC 27725]MCF0171071.1 2-C-methyl-D-erythritol 4-phosphate cytidylyltransferase [Fusobacterium varium]MCF2674120.1 2-C-methyl-D-erythri